MAGFTDLLGSILQQGMSQSSGARMGNALGGGSSGESLEGLMAKLAKQMGNTGGQPEPVEQTRRASPVERSAPGGMDLGGILGGMLGGLSNNKTAMGGLGSLIGALTGAGQQQAGASAVGGGGLAMLASLAMAALQGAGQTPAQTPRALMERTTEDDQYDLEEDAEIIVRAMINAAKADGQVGKAEIQRIVGKLEEDGLTQQEKEFFMSEANKPMDLSAVISSARNQPEVAAQIYTASLLAIEVDTIAEQNYMKQLAAGLGLHPEVASYIERTLGV